MACPILSIRPSRSPTAFRILNTRIRGQQMRCFRRCSGERDCQTLWTYSCRDHSPTSKFQQSVPPNEFARGRRRTSTLTARGSANSFFDRLPCGGNDISIRSESTSSVYYDNTLPWEEWFPPEEYENPWSNKHLEPLDNVFLDNQSRFVLQLLQDMYQISLARRKDRITTQRCNAVISKLLDDSNITSARNDGGRDSTQKRHSHRIKQHADRAYAILLAMEMFLPLQEQFQHTKLPVPLPVPNHETYWSVLKLYASRYLHGDRDVPMRCRAIVERMREFSSSPMSSPLVQKHRLELKPGSLHYNLVLAAWANSKDPRRPLEAAQLLYHLHTQEAEGAGNFIDASSYSHAFRACLSLDKRGQVLTPEFKELAPEVAVRLWTALLRQHEDSTSEGETHQHLGDENGRQAGDEAGEEMMDRYPKPIENNVPDARGKILMNHGQFPVDYQDGENHVLSVINNAIGVQNYISDSDLFEVIPKNSDHAVFNVKDPVFRQLKLAQLALQKKNGGRYEMVEAATNNNKRKKAQEKVIESFQQLLLQDEGIFIASTYTNDVDGKSVGHCFMFNAGSGSIADRTATTVPKQVQNLSETQANKMMKSFGYHSLRYVYVLKVKLKDVEAGHVEHFIGPENDRKEIETHPIDTVEDPTSPKVIAFTSFLYAHFLRACRNFDNRDSKRDAVVAQVFRDCCTRGKVNPHVLHEFLNLASPRLQREILGKYGLGDGSDPLVLVRRIPPNWIEHADGDKYNW